VIRVARGGFQYRQLGSLHQFESVIDVTTGGAHCMMQVTIYNTVVGLVQQQVLIHVEVAERINHKYLVEVS
jgi:hypothetical protein